MLDKVPKLSLEGTPQTAVNPEPFALVAIDLDGTLLQSDKRIGPRSAEAIGAVIDRGIHVILASARPPRGVQAYYECLGLKSLQVNYNGALIHDAVRQQHVYHKPLDPHLAKQIVALAREVQPEVVVHVEVLDQWYTDRVDPNLQVETSKDSDPDYLGPIESCLNQPVTKLMFLAQPEKLVPVRSAIELQFGNRTAIAISDRHVLQVVHHEVDKATAIDHIASGMGIGANKVMAIGDAPNDVDMLRWAGLGIAMENAWPEARLAADRVIGSNDHDGVAEILDRFVLQA